MITLLLQMEALAKFSRLPKRAMECIYICLHTLYTNPLNYTRCDLSVVMIILMFDKMDMIVPRV